MTKENIKKDKLPAIKEPTLSERFTNMVVKEFTSTVGGDNPQGLTAFHKRLCQNYFIVIDGVLKKAEINRLRKNENRRDKIPVLWDNINMNQLALDVVASSRIGLDPAQPNHINMIPYKNNSTSKYDIVFIIGYRGSELKAKKYGLEIPNDVIVEIVRENDSFKQIKKDMNNETETYTFEIKDSNNRGDIVGGFYYYVFDENPRRNTLRYFTISDIKKRKPTYASVEFWGGEKDKWENGKKTGKETIDGWFEEMCWKTIYRSAYNNITIDSQKIDDDFLRLKSNENEYSAQSPENQIQESANEKTIDIDSEDITEKPEVKDEKAPEKEVVKDDKIKSPELSKKSKQFKTEF